MPTCTRIPHLARSLSGRLRQERGQTLVEFAIVLPVLVLIILGILYFGRYEDYANQETQLAESADRYAAVDYSPTVVNGQACTASLQAYIKCQAAPELQNGSSDVTSPAAVWIYQPSGATYSVGQPIRVCVVATVTFPSPIGTPSATIAQAATMRIEQVPANGTFPYTTSNPGGSSTPPTQCPTS